jgi:uncharacterized protein with ATP-grasp and redox domains
MKTCTACPACFVDDLAGALDRLALPEEARRAVLAEGLDYLARELSRPAGWDRIPSAHITALHRILKRRTGLALPFADLRAACNRVGSELARALAGELEGTPGPERFRALVRWAIAGNHLDFRTVGTGYGFSVEAIRRKLDEVAARPLDRDEVEAIRGLAAGRKTILYVPDNVGEIAWDALLVRELRSMGARVLVPYRGGPITSDATLEDFRSVGLDRAADEVFEAGPDTLGFSLEEMSPRLREILDSAEVVITKGQANYYAISELLPRLPGRVACLLRTKCAPASRGFGLPGPGGIAAVLK